MTTLATGSSAGWATSHGAAGCSGGRADRIEKFARPKSSPPAADHFSVVVVLKGEVYHCELPIPTPAVMAWFFKDV